MHGDPKPLDGLPGGVGWFVVDAAPLPLSRPKPSWGRRGPYLTVGRKPSWGKAGPLPASDPKTLLGQTASAVNHLASADGSH